MPFTPSHAVVALPFVRSPLVPAAIAVGAMTPDLPLFLRGTPLSYGVTHSNLVVTTVVALVLLTLWYNLLRPAVREFVPLVLARRLPPEWDASGLAPWRTLKGERSWVATAVVLVASLLIGVVSHIVWDAFTHEGRAGVDLLPALSEQWGPLLGYKWLQHGSSVMGLVVIGLYAGLWLRKRVPEQRVVRLLPSRGRVTWWALLPALLIAAWILGLVQYGQFTGEWTPQHLAYRVLPPACAVWALLTVLLCAAVQVRRLRSKSL